MAAKPGSKTPKGPPWGVFTLLFLALAFVMVVLSATKGHYTGAMLLGLVVGLVGAGCCTVLGLRKARSYRLAGSDRPLR